MGPRIATCCYCGTRAALVLRGRDRQELSCASCGAPLTRLRAIPVTQQTAAPVVTHSAAPMTRRKPVSGPCRAAAPRPDQDRYPRKRRKPALSRWMEEIRDVIEDVFD